MRYIALLVSVLMPILAWADTPVIEHVTAQRTGNMVRFDVTLRHADEGWDHYADGWGVYTLDGAELGYRTLHHPHVTEQPFTRSLSVEVPRKTQAVIIRPRDSVHGEGADFEVALR